MHARPKQIIVALAALLGTTGGLMAGAAPASAIPADTYSLLGCGGTQIYNVSICLYRSQQNYNILQGRFINNSDVGIYNDGFFQYSTGSVARDCGYFTTAAHTVSSCTVSFSAGQPTVRLGDTYYYNGGYPQAYTAYFAS